MALRSSVLSDLNIPGARFKGLYWKVCAREQINYPQKSFQSTKNLHDFESVLQVFYLGSRKQGQVRKKIPDNFPNFRQQEKLYKTLAIFETEMQALQPVVLLKKACYGLII